MLHNVFLKTLWDQRWSLPWWTIGLVALAVITLLFYPFVRDTPLLDELTEWMPEVLLRAFVVPLVLLAYAIVEGTGAIAGEEERGTLDLLLSNPLTRRRVVVEKFAALMGTTLVLAIGVAIVEMEISLGRVAKANLSARFLGMTFGACLALGSITGKRGLSIGVASVLGFAAYFLNALAPLVKSLEPLTKLSPFTILVLTR